MTRPLPKTATMLGRDRRGVVGLEFALLVPIIVTLLLGCFELCYALQAGAKLRTMAESLAEVLASQNSVNSSSLADMCVGGQLMMSPLPATSVSAAIASVTNYTTGGVITDWQDSSCGNATAIANPPSAVASLVTDAGDTAIMVQASYTYKHPMAFFLPSSMTLTQQAFARPYSNQTVTKQ